LQQQVLTKNRRQKVMKCSIATIVVVAIIAGSSFVQASMSFAVDGVAPLQFPGPVPPPATAAHIVDGQGYPGDTVGLQADRGSFDLAPGTFVQKINTLNWTVNWTYAGGGNPSNPDGDWQELSFTVNAFRDITIGSQTVTLSQTGLLEVNWDNDYLSFSTGSTSSLYVEGYRIDITPLAVERTGAEFPAGPPWNQPDQDMMARFDVTAVPEPSTYIAGTLLLLPFGLQGIRHLRNRKQA
jgi:hypothetical protein